MDLAKIGGSSWNVPEAKDAENWAKAFAKCAYKGRVSPKGIKGFDLCWYQYYDTKDEGQIVGELTKCYESAIKDLAPQGLDLVQMYASGSGSEAAVTGFAFLIPSTEADWWLPGSIKSTDVIDLQAKENLKDKVRKFVKAKADATKAKAGAKEDLKCYRKFEYISC